MPKVPKYYLVEATALPSIILKVAEAKRYIETGEVKTVNEAARNLGISRSAFYKYKDAVMPFYDMSSGRIMTFNAILKDEPGVLSSILSIFANSDVNILTINQSIPVNGCAAVTVSAETGEMNKSMGEFIAEAREAYGVIKFEALAG